MGNPVRDTSKFLSYILRHEPEFIGLALDSEGWAEISVLIEAAKTAGKSFDRELLQQVVDTNDKKRFAISGDGLRIRAVQGHSSMSVAIDYAELIPPQILHHGTATRFMDSINREGLRPGQRHHVHLSADEKTANAVGARRGQVVILRIEAMLMYEAGYKFFQADNGVWLTAEVPVEIF
jgi:putative RNA 2'-phosphotransferase